MLQRMTEHSLVPSRVKTCAEPSLYKRLTGIVGTAWFEERRHPFHYNNLLHFLHWFTNLVVNPSWPQCLLRGYHLFVHKSLHDVAYRRPPVFFVGGSRSGNCTLNSSWTVRKLLVSWYFFTTNTLCWVFNWTILATCSFLHSVYISKEWYNCLVFVDGLN